MSKRSAIYLNKPSIGLAERFAVDKVLRSGKLAQGERVAEFEDAFSNMLNGVACVALNSGTSALHLSLLALGIQAGDEVIVPTFTFAATANAVAVIGATPVFVDIEENFFSISVPAIEAAVTSRTKAVIAVHLYGHPAQLDLLSAMCNRLGLLLIEDAAQAHLASFDGKPVGTWGDAGAFSFYPTKNMTTSEGGMASTSSELTQKNIRLLRNQGMEIRYQNEIAGFNNRMTEISAVIGLVQLSKLKKWTEKRQRNASFFEANLSGVITPKVHSQAVHVYHQYTIQVDERDRKELQSALSTEKIASDVYYPTPVHELPVYALSIDTPIAKRLSKEALSLPVHQNLSRSDLERIVDVVNRTMKAGS